MVATSAAAWHRIRPSFAGRQADTRPIFARSSVRSRPLRHAYDQLNESPLRVHSVTYTDSQVFSGGPSRVSSCPTSMSLTLAPRGLHVHRAVLGCSSPPHEKM